MDRVRTTWREDRRQLVLLVVWLTAGVCTVVPNTERPVLATVAAVCYGYLAIRQALEVFVRRPRRLAATGDRESTRVGFW